MSPRSSATAFDRLAPDQRAAVELVLRQGRSYGELSDLLGMPEETIRTRARGGVAGLAPGPRGAGPGRARSRTGCSASSPRRTPRGPARCCWPIRRSQPLGRDGRRRRCARPRAARPSPSCRPGPRSPPRAATGAIRVPTRDDGRAHRRAATTNGATQRRGGARGDHAPVATGGDRVRGDDAVDGGHATPTARTTRPPGAPRGSAARSSSAPRCCSSRSCSRSSSPAATTTRSRPPTRRSRRPPPPRPRRSTGNQILLRGPAGSKAVGADGARSRPTTARSASRSPRSGVAPNQSGQKYSVWFRKKDGASILLGDVKNAVAENGELTTAGPSNDGRREVPGVVRHLRLGAGHRGREGREGAGQGHPQRRPAALPVGLSACSSPAPT